MKILRPGGISLMCLMFMLQTRIAYVICQEMGSKSEEMDMIAITYKKTFQAIFIHPKS